MKTIDEKIDYILKKHNEHGVRYAIDDLKALFEAECLEIIGSKNNENYAPTESWMREDLREEQRAALKEKLGKTKEQS